MIRMAEVLKQVKKKYGGEALNRIGDMKNHQSKIPRFSSGSLIIDSKLGGGWPVGRIIEISGPEGGGKTSVSLHAVAEIQKLGEKAYFIDVEHALDEEWAIKLGVNVDDLYLSQPDTGEQALELAQAVVEAEDVPLIVVDSVSALVPRAEIEGEMGDSHMGLQARLMGQAMRKLTGRVSKTKTTIIFINQIRMKIGVMFGNPETTSGGMALGFYSSIRMRVSKGQPLKENDEVIGNRVRIDIKKNKTAAPFKKCEVELYYESGGIRQDNELGQLMLESGIIYKNGAMYTIPAKEDFDKMLNGHSLVLNDLIKAYPNIERNKVKSREKMLQAIRQNKNIQETGKEVLQKGGVI